MSDDEEGDYGFAYSDQEEEVEEEKGAVEAQNQYYNGKGLKQSGDVPGATAAFTSVLALEKDNADIGDWAFKATKQLTKMYILTGDFAAGLANFRWVIFLFGDARGTPRLSSFQSLTRIFILLTTPTPYSHP